MFLVILSLILWVTMSTKLLYIEECLHVINKVSYIECLLYFHHSVKTIAILSLGMDLMFYIVLVTGLYSYWGLRSHWYSCVSKDCITSISLYPLHEICNYKWLKFSNLKNIKSYLFPMQHHPSMPYGLSYPWKIDHIKQQLLQTPL